MEENRYYKAFWNKMRGQRVPDEHVSAGRSANGTYSLPDSSLKKFETLKDKEDIFSGIMTRTKVLEDHKIFVRTTDHAAEWIPEGGAIPGFEGEEDYAKYMVERHKLAVLVKYSNDFIHSPSFDAENNVLGAFAKAVSGAEEMAFINGDGTDMPYGLLHEERGAETGVTANSLTFDNVISLFLSVKPKYRKNGKWLMNDETALVLRTLKDDNGNYLWNHSNDTILGKEVIISEHMPTEGTPILFGDLSYYWIIERKKLNIMELKERFAANDQTAYLGYEFLDGMLTKRDAVKGYRLA